MIAVAFRCRLPVALVAACWILVGCGHAQPQRSLEERDAWYAEMVKAQTLRARTLPLDRLLTRIAEHRSARARDELAGTLDERVIDAVVRDFPCLNAALLRRLVKEQPSSRPLFVRLLAAEGALTSPVAVAGHAQDLVAALATCGIEEKRQQAVDDLRESLVTQIGGLRTAIALHRRIVDRLIREGLRPPLRGDEDHPGEK